MKRFLLAMLAVIYTLVTLIMSIMSYITIKDLRQENTMLKSQLQTLRDSYALQPPAVLNAQTVLVDLENSYCNLVIDHWESDQNNLNIVTAYAQAVISSDAPTATAENACLILKLNGETLVSTAEITLQPGESSESLEADIRNISFSIPALSATDELELWLEVALPGNLTISGYCASWYQEGGILRLITG